MTWKEADALRGKLVRINCSGWGACQGVIVRVVGVHSYYPTRNPPLEEPPTTLVDYAIECEVGTSARRNPLFTEATDVTVIDEAQFRFAHFTVNAEAWKNVKVGDEFEIHDLNYGFKAKYTVNNVTPEGDRVRVTALVGKEFFLAP